MSGEDPWDAPQITGDFRLKCWQCGKQIQYAGGQRVKPDCGCPEYGIEIEIGKGDQRD